HREHEDSLIDHRDLIEGGFKRLLDLFRQSQHREVLRRAISFEIASRQFGPGLESRYILCHAGLGAIAHELSDGDRTAPRYKKADWKELRRRLESLIDTFRQTHSLQDKLVEYTKRKLPELGRPAIAESLIHH